MYFQEEMTIVYQYENAVFACDETLPQLVAISSVENVNSPLATAVESRHVNISQPSCLSVSELLSDMAPVPSKSLMSYPRRIGNGGHA